MNETRAHSIVGFRPEGRPVDDFYPTPPEAVTALADSYPLPERIWEPACGDGAISRVLEERGHTVFSSDLFDHGYGAGGLDFLKFRLAAAPTVVTNPPYRLAEDFIWHSLAIGVDRLCLLLKLSFLEGAGRGQLFDLYPPKRVMVFRKRLTMTRGGNPSRNGGMIAFAWFIWERGYSGKPEIWWLSTRKEIEA